ncbi:MAG TPA: DUF2339 domain-containing protein [Terracidiphilus sp.]|jgi:uncharacterized membrane protein
MDYLLIVVLGIVVVAMWNSSRDAHERFRDAIDRLEREIEFLRSQVAALMKTNAKPAETATSSSMSEGPVAMAEAPPQPVRAGHAVAPPVQGFTAPVSPRPAQAVTPAVVPAVPEQAPVPVAQPAASQPGAAASVQPIQPVPQVEKPREQETRPAAPERQPEPAPAAAAKPPVPAAAPPIHAAAAYQAAGPQGAPPQAESQRTSAGARLFSLEETLGANWLNKIGIAILVIGLAFFLAYKLQTWGPGGKVLCGFAVSVALLGGGVWLERKPMYRIFARGGIGGGWALAYFTTFAMYHLQAARVLDSLPVDLVLMMLVAAGMVGHSLRYRSQTVTALAFLLGFGTLLTSHLEEPNQTVVFSLAASAILAIALVVVTTIRHWAVLELCGLIAVYVSHFVWLNEVLPANHASFAEFWPSTALILFYWLIFRLAYVLRIPQDKREEDLSSMSAILNSGGVLGLLKFQSAHPEWAFWALVVLGVVEMALAYWAKAKRRQAFVVLSTIAVVLLVSSVPFRFHGVSWPVLWLVQAQVLAIAGLRLGEPVFRRLGLLVGLISGAVLALHDVMPLAMERLVAADPNHHWSLTAGLALAAILYWTHAEIYPRRWPGIEANAMETFALKVSSWLGLGAAATCLWVVLPNRWLPAGWIALFLVMVFAGYWFGAKRAVVEGDVLALMTAGVLAFNHVLPLAFFRLDHADPGRHPVETVVLALAALAYWLRAEVFPRRLRSLEGTSAESLGGWLAFILPCTSWLGLGAAAAAMWAGMPDQWLPLGWIGLFVVLVVTAHVFSAAMLAVEGDVLALGTAGVLAFHHVLPLVFSRFENADPGRHTAMTVLLSIAALAYWVRGELFPRTLPKLSAVPSWDPSAWEAVMLPLASCVGTAAAATAMWVALPVQWVAVGWFVMVVVLGLAADWIASGALALQADALVIASLLGLAGWDLWHNDWKHHTPVLVGVALLYVAMRRKKGAGNYVPAAYSWAAAVVLLWVTFDIFANPWIAPVLTGLCLILFEVGRFVRKGFLRWQGYTLLAIAFVVYLSNNLPYAAGGWMSSPAAKAFNFVGSDLLEVLILIAGGYWLLERTRSSEAIGKAEHSVGLIADAAGTFCLMAWFGVQFPFYVQGGEGWIAAIWACMATVLMGLAWGMRRRTFEVQAIALALAAVMRGLLFDLIGEAHGDFWHGPLYRLSVTAFVLLAALPFAFKLRGPKFWEGASLTLPEPFASGLRSPEQWFFFAPFGMMVAALAVKLSSGHITIAWSLLGLGTFLFALAVGERSFRLAGLILLLVSVAKILLMDVWKLSTPDKFTTLIILGVALIAVSFLYTRFGATIKKYL